ncbi:MAG TPA: hypothetical protein VMG10_13890 [Gemmataceae bacterium]|nr:hypothetical protein [Gemmataceae bacterium]
MSFATLLFPSQAQGMVNVAQASREEEHELFTGFDACEKACDGAGRVPEDYLLPSGIFSMEHWLDLNA